MTNAEGQAECRMRKAAEVTDLPPTAPSEAAEETTSDSLDCWDRAARMALIEGGGSGSLLSEPLDDRDPWGEDPEEPVGLDQIVADYEGGVRGTTSDWRRLQGAARSAAQRATKSGRIMPTSCCVCRVHGPVQGHHWSYRREYWCDVLSLCPRCHSWVHGYQALLRLSGARAQLMTATFTDTRDRLSRDGGIIFALDGTPLPWDDAVSLLSRVDGARYYRTEQWGLGERAQWEQRERDWKMMLAKNYAVVQTPRGWLQLARLAEITPQNERAGGVVVYRPASMPLSGYEISGLLRDLVDDPESWRVDREHRILSYDGGTQGKWLVGTWDETEQPRKRHVFRLLARCASKGLAMERCVRLECDTRVKRRVERLSPECYRHTGPAPRMKQYIVLTVAASEDIGIELGDAILGQA